MLQAGLQLYRDSEDVVITEDYLIAGVLREKIPGGWHQQLEVSMDIHNTPHWSNSTWDAWPPKYFVKTFARFR